MLLRSQFEYRRLSMTCLLRSTRSSPKTTITWKDSFVGQTTRDEEVMRGDAVGAALVDFPQPPMHKPPGLGWLLRLWSVLTLWQSQSCQSVTRERVASSHAEQEQDAASSHDVAGAADLEAGRHPLMSVHLLVSLSGFSVALGRTASDAGTRDPTRAVVSRFWSITFFPDGKRAPFQHGHQGRLDLHGQRIPCVVVRARTSANGTAKPGKSGYGYMVFLRQFRAIRRRLGLGRSSAASPSGTGEYRSISKFESALPKPKRGANGAPTAKACITSSHSKLIHAGSPCVPLRGAKSPRGRHLGAARRLDPSCRMRASSWGIFFLPTQRCGQGSSVPWLRCTGNGTKLKGLSRTPANRARFAEYCTQPEQKG